MIRAALRLVPIMISGGLGVSSAACGDVSRIVLDVTFPREQVELDTRALEIIVRETQAVSVPCSSLWDRGPTNQAEDRAVIEYPNRVDLRASPVDLDRYDLLEIRAYAFAGFPITGLMPIAGGCARVGVEGGKTTEILIELIAR